MFKLDLCDNEGCAYINPDEVAGVTEEPSGKYTFVTLKSGQKFKAVGRVAEFLFGKAKVIDISEKVAAAAEKEAAAVKAQQLAVKAAELRAEADEARKTADSLEAQASEFKA